MSFPPRKISPQCTLIRTLFPSMRFYSSPVPLNTYITQGKGLWEQLQTFFSHPGRVKIEKTVRFTFTHITTHMYIYINHSKKFRFLLNQQHNFFQPQKHYLKFRSRHTFQFEVEVQVNSRLILEMEKHIPDHLLITKPQPATLHPKKLQSP